MNFLLELDRETKHELKDFLSENHINHFEIFQESVTLLEILGVSFSALGAIDIIYNWIQKRKRDKPDTVVNLKIDDLKIDLINIDLEKFKQALQNKHE